MVKTYSFLQLKQYSHLFLLVTQTQSMFLDDFESGAMSKVRFVNPLPHLRQSVSFAVQCSHKIE